MSEPRVGDLWSQNDIMTPGTRQWFRVMSIDHDRGTCAVRYEKEGRKRGGHKSLSNMRAGLRGCRLEEAGDGTPPADRQKPRRPTVASANHWATVAQRSTASDYRKLVPPRWMTAEEKKKWREENARSSDK